MVKRKNPESKNIPKYAGEPESESEFEDVLDVDFEFFDPQPDVDFHGIKSLLRQLFDSDSQLVKLSQLTDLILNQPLLGSTVKVDGNETDPWAFLTVLNVQEHRSKEGFEELVTYLLRQATMVDALKPIAELLSEGSQAQIGLLLMERMMNVPAQLAPPMYKMLLEEMQWAVEEKEPYAFTHYLIISKVYTEIESELSVMNDEPTKKKKKGSRKEGEVFYFHPEDEVIQRHSLAQGYFSYMNEEGDGHSDSRRAFQDAGIKPQGCMMLIKSDKFEDLVGALEEFATS